MITVTCERCKSSARSKNLSELTYVLGWNLDVLSKFPQVCKGCLVELNKKSPEKMVKVQGNEYSESTLAAMIKKYVNGE